MRKLLAPGLGLLALVSLTAVRARSQARPAAEPQRVLNPDTVAVRLLLGVGDTQIRPRGGKGRVDRGRPALVERPGGGLFLTRRFYTYSGTPPRG